MDQAKTLRHLLGQQKATIHPILGDLEYNYAACLGRFILEQQAAQSHTAILFDGSANGLVQLIADASRKDLLLFFQGQANLEDQVAILAEGQYLVPSAKGLSALADQPEQSRVLLGKLHRLPVTADMLYATLPYEATRLASAFLPEGDWFWVIQPTASSVTRAFQGLRSSKGVGENIQHRVIVAGVRNANEADHVFANLLETTTPFLNKPLQYAGHMPALELKKPLSQISQGMVTAGRRIAKAIGSIHEHALA